MSTLGCVPIATRSLDIYSMPYLHFYAHLHSRLIKPCFKFWGKKVLNGTSKTLLTVTHHLVAESMWEYMKQDDWQQQLPGKLTAAPVSTGKQKSPSSEVLEEGYKYSLCTEDHWGTKTTRRPRACSCWDGSQELHVSEKQTWKEKVSLLVSFFGYFKQT